MSIRDHEEATNRAVARAAEKGISIRSALLEIAEELHSPSEPPASESAEAEAAEGSKT